MQSRFSERVAGVLGNILGHYDTALFGLLAPFMAPLFFEGYDPIAALILTYGMLPLGLFTQPLGSLFFGWIGDSFGRKQALFYSMGGMAIASVGMGCLPLYSEAGLVAPLLLGVGRMLNSFCAAGEKTGAAIFILEHTSKSKRSFVSSLYDTSSILGVLMASGLVTVFSFYGWVEEGWRVLFWLGGLIAIFGFFFRMTLKQGLWGERRSPLAQREVLVRYKGVLTAILLSSGFSYTTYSFAFTFMNGFVPLVTDLTKAEVVHINTWLLGVDMLLLPCFGWLAQKVGKERVMLVGALGSALGALPLFYLLNGATVWGVVAVRLIIILFGVAFAAPYHAFALERVPVEHRYTLLSFGKALGSQLIGAPTAVIGLWLYQTTGWVIAPGFYLMGVASMASLVVLYFMNSPYATRVTLGLKRKLQRY